LKLQILDIVNDIIQYRRLITLETIINIIDVVLITFLKVINRP
jgi:hypothetical protein